MFSVMRNTLFVRTVFVGGLSLVMFLTGQLANGSLGSRAARKAFRDSERSEYYVRLLTPVQEWATADQAPSIVVESLNGIRMHCPDRSESTRCIVSKIEIPDECKWECRDGLLALQGVTVFRGTFTTETDTEGRSSRFVFRVRAGFDTWRNEGADSVVYRVSESDLGCARRPCVPVRSIRKVNRQVAFFVRSLDFSQVDDPNFRANPSLASVQLRASEGLLASGFVEEGVFHVRYVWRQWIPALSR